MTVQRDIFPTTANETGADARTLRRMERVLRWLSEHYTDQPTLEETASVIGLGPHHFQRLFTRYVGVSPKKYVQFLTLEHAKRSLADSASVLDAAFDAGLSGPGRLHDLFVTHEALTPGEWKTQAGGLDLRYGWHDSPFGDCLIVASERGVCGLAFAAAQDRTRAFENLARNFGGARLTWDTPATAEHAEMAFVTAVPAVFICYCGPRRSSSKCGRRCCGSPWGRPPAIPIWRCGSASRQPSARSPVPWPPIRSRG